MKRFVPLILLLALASLLPGCGISMSGRGAAPAAPAAGDGKDWVTSSDEPEVRKRARLRLELAAGYFEQGQITVALDEVKQALVIDPNYSMAYNLRGLIYMRLDEPRLAESSFQQALKLAPKDPDSWHNLGWLQCQDKRYAEAMRSFTAALQSPVYTSAARTWMAQGICQARAGQTADAERSLVRSFELDASNPITMYNLAELLFQREALTNAQFYIRRLNNSEMANAESLWLGVRIEQRLGNREGVRQLGDQLKRRFPESRELKSFERGAFNE